MKNMPDFTAIADPVIRERFALGHHPRRTAAAPAVDEPLGWYTTDAGVQMYRAGDQLLYRIDDLGDGQYQVHKADWRPDFDTYRGPLGPVIPDLDAAKLLVELDAEVQLKKEMA